MAPIRYATLCYATICYARPPCRASPAYYASNSAYAQAGALRWLPRVMILIHQQAALRPLRALRQKRHHAARVAAKMLLYVGDIVDIARRYEESAAWRDIRMSERHIRRCWLPRASHVTSAATRYAAYCARTMARRHAIDVFFFCHIVTPIDVDCRY